MATAETTTEYQEPTYGNWRKPATAGIGKMSGVATAMVFILLLVLIIVMQFIGLIAAGVVFIIGLVLVAAFAVPDKNGLVFAERVGERVLYVFGKKSRRNVYRSGPLGLSNQGSYKLPGVAASSKLYEGRDSLERPFAMLEMSAVSVFSTAISVEPDGASMVDQEAVDQWVANWGGFLGSLGRETGLIGASATVETAPGSGVQVRKEIESTMSDDASDVAQQMLREAAETYPMGAADIRCWVTLTFSASPRAGMKKRTAEEMARELAMKLPAFCERLESTGAGVATPMTGQELSEIVRVGYDPAAAKLFEDAYYASEDVELDWDQIGPAAAESEWEGYRHDSGVTRCWTMTEAPRGHTFSNVFGRMVAPNRAVPRKRVTMLYRPIDSGRTANVVEKDQNTARVRATSSRNTTQRASLDLKAADATAAEEARGAGLLYFGLIISATVMNADDLPEAVATIEQDLSPAARISLRPAYNAHDSMLAATLPLGLVLGRHAMVPESMKVAL